MKFSLNSIYIVILIYFSNIFTLSFALANDNKHEETITESLAVDQNTINENTDPFDDVKTESEYRKIISEYKSYITRVPPKVRSEIFEFRLKILELQQQKRKIYSKLSVEAQQYLENEQVFRNKLPILNLKKEVKSEKK